MHDVKKQNDLSRRAIVLRQGELGCAADRLAQFRRDRPAGLKQARAAIGRWEEDRLVCVGGGAANCIESSVFGKTSVSILLERQAIAEVLRNILFVLFPGTLQAEPGVARGAAGRHGNSHSMLVTHTDVAHTAMR